MMEEIRKPVLGISIGDINGVGPEIIMRIFSDARMLEVCTPVIYCNGRIFGFYRKFLNHIILFQSLNFFVYMSQNFLLWTYLIHIFQELFCLKIMSNYSLKN